MAIDPRITNVGDVKYDPVTMTHQTYTSDRTWTTIDTSTMAGGPYITTSTDTGMRVDCDLTVKGRNVLEELDEMRDALLLLKRDVNLEAKYPELKEAYNNYMELYRGLQIADKLTNSGLE